MILRVVSSQIQEMNTFQQVLMDLERTQQVMKKQLRVLILLLVKNNWEILMFVIRYEEEIARLRQQLDQVHSGSGYVPPPPENKVPPPMLSSTNPPLVNVPQFGSPLPQPTSQQQPSHSNRPTAIVANKAPVPVQNPNSSNNPAIILSDLDPESVPANMKVEGSDWFAL